MNNVLYAPSPANVNPAILAPSLAFKKQVGKVVSSIILFFIVYILLVLASTGLAIACFYFGAWLIIQMPRFIILMVGLGLMALGISVVFFLIKFIFSVSKNEKASRVEVKEKDQPELFLFIRKLTKETGTRFPKKIFLSGDVNASVFYNSGFWSMFLPVRKNLEVGLGLVNSINISEFKAVIAHEFGHFSQRSMKLGSFTYNVNQIIYNMLYENTGYNTFLNSWATVNRYFSFFAGITVKIAAAIQWILKQMYQVINKNYLGLSREMEFHADAVSASVSGGNNLISALNRIELASSCYNIAMNNVEYWLKQNKKSKNIFENQLTIFRTMAKEHLLPLKDGLPDVSFQFLQSFSQSRVYYKNQWASHPTLEERKTHLEQLETNISPNEFRAWRIFKHQDILQEQMTAALYKNVKVEEIAEQIDGQYFDDWYNKERDAVKLPALYKGFYDNRYINIKDWDINSLIDKPSKNFDGLFNDENGRLHSSITNNENDIAKLKAIKEKQIDIKTFEFDGIRHEIMDCDAIIMQLEEEVVLQINKQMELDKEVLAFFCKTTNENNVYVISAYKEYQLVYNQYDGYEKVANPVLNTINPFYSANNSIADVKLAVDLLKGLHEKHLKESFKNLLNDNIITVESKDDLYNRLKIFNDKEYLYFAFDTFRSEELKELSDLTIKVADELNKLKFTCFKKLLETQLEYYQN